MQTLAQIKLLLEEHGLTPKKSLGQNFLVDHNLIRKLVDAAGVTSGELVLEVGPGTGTLTEELLARGCRVVACELDDGLAAMNAQRLPAIAQQHSTTFTLIHDDCLAGKHAINPKIIAALAGRPFALVANLPYGAATPLMSLVMVEHPECRMLAVTIQREVIDRLAAGPGSKDYGGLSVVAQAACEVKRLASLPPECFWPRPDVTSGMVILTRRAMPLDDLRALSAFCRVVFAQRRKQLSSVLAKSEIPPVDWGKVAQTPGCEAITPNLRAEQLSVVQLIALRRAIGFATSSYVHVNPDADSPDSRT